MKSWYIYTDGLEQECQHIAYYPSINKLVLRICNEPVGFICDREQYFGAKEGEWTLVEHKQSTIFYEIIFK